VREENECWKYVGFRVFKLNWCGTRTNPNCFKTLKTSLLFNYQLKNNSALVLYNYVISVHTIFLYVSTRPVQLSEPKCPVLNPFRKKVFLIHIIDHVSSDVKEPKSIQINPNPTKIYLILPSVLKFAAFLVPMEPDCYDLYAFPYLFIFCFWFSLISFTQKWIIKKFIFTVEFFLPKI